MGGIGSGRYGGRPVVDECRSLDVNRLHREGCLRPGWSGSFHWSRDDEEVAAIGMRATQGRLTLSYRYRRNDEDWQDVEEPVAIVRTPCQFGGSRPWFVCPGVVDGVPLRPSGRQTLRTRPILPVPALLRARLPEPAAAGA
jgi:hypothetical protein